VPRVKVVRLEDGRIQIGILANNPSEQPGRLTTIPADGDVKAAADALYAEWEQERRQRLQRQADRFAQ